MSRYIQAMSASWGRSLSSDICVGDLELFLVDGELNGGRRSHCSQVVHARLEAQLPACEMHRSDLAHGWLFDVNVERLRLINECTPISCHLYYCTLTDLPDGLVQGFDVGGDVVNILDGTTVRNDSVLHIVRPETKVDKVFEQPWIDNLEFASQHAARIDVGSVGLEALVISKDL